LLPWTLFAQSMGMATTTVIDGAGLLRSVRFPRAVLPLSTVLFNLLQYLMTFGVLLPVMMLAFGVAPSTPMLAYPLVLLLLVLFITGATLMVATAATFFRDVKHLVEVALGVMFWTTPIIYDLQDVPEALRLPILLSPMSAFVTALHDIFYTGGWPSGPTWVAALAWATSAFFGGVAVFLSFEDRLVEHV
jgi:ABC-2 type transport system permease protein